MTGTMKNEYDEIYSAYADLLYRLALSHLKNSYDAEDAVQEAFIAYFHHKGNFTDDNHRKAWLVRVLLNKCTDHIRKSTRVKTVEIDDSIAAKNGEDDGVFMSMETFEEREKMFRHRDAIYAAEISRLSGEPAVKPEELHRQMEALFSAYEG